MVWSLAGAIVGALPAYFAYRYLLDSGRLDRLPRISGPWVVGLLMGLRLIYFVHDSPDNPMAGTGEMIVLMISIAAANLCLTLMVLPTRSKRA